MRGVYTGAYLESLERGFKTRRNVESLDIGKAFQLIVGTSTGAIIACALATGVPPERIVSLYKETGPQIFRSRMPSTSAGVLGQLLTRKREMRLGDEALKR